MDRYNRCISLIAFSHNYFLNVVIFNILQVYEIPLGGSLVRQNFAIGGSGSTYIYGLVDATYRENMTRDECKEFVKKSISHAMARDGSSGGVIRLVIIDKDGVEKECILGMYAFKFFFCLNIHKL